MKKIISGLLCVFLTVSAHAADSAPSARISVFSTSTDWQAVTGLRLNEYNGRFIPDKRLVGRGIILYYLDGFPCYGLGYGVRVWVGPNFNDEHLHIACVASPTEIKFAYRNAERDATQATTTGIMTCPVDGDGRELTIDMSKCSVGPDWDEYK